MRHERGKRVEATSSMPIFTGHLESVDLENSNDVIHFLLGESMTIGDVSRKVGLYFLPMGALLFDVIHHDLNIEQCS